MKTNKTFAQRAKDIDNMYKNRDLNTIEMRTFELEMDKLAKEQELSKLTSMATNIFKLGGDIGEPIKTLPEITDRNEIKKLFEGFDFGEQSAIGFTPQVEPLNPKTIPTVPEVKPFDLGQRPMPVEENAIGKFKNLFSGLKMPESLNAKPSDISTFDNYLTPVLMGKTAELLTKSAMLFNGPEKENPVFNPYEQAVKDKFSGRINNDSVINDIMAGRNSALEQVNSRSMNISNAFNQNINNNASRSTAENNRNTQSINLQLDAQEGNVLNQLGANKQQMMLTVADLDSRNRAAFNNNLATVSESIGNFGQAITNHKAGLLQQSIIAQAIKSNNFKLSAKFLKDLEQGKVPSLDEAIEFTGDEEQAKDLVKQYEALSKN